MTILLKKINEKVSKLKSEFEVNKDINHDGVKGSLNENEFSSLLKDVIPQRFRITKGIIENSQGQQSNETDIIIYDDEILPAYIKNELSFVPVEAVKYNFEIKSILNSTELKTTINKFLNFRSIGGNSPSVLFAYSTDIKGSELARYFNSEDNNSFFVNPSISVICVSNKCYYYKSVTEHYLHNFFSNEEWLKMFGKASGLRLDEVNATFQEIISNNEILSKMNRSQFALYIKACIQMENKINGINSSKLEINGINLSDVKFKVHKWIGIEKSESSSINDVELSLLSGISNTLSKGKLGNYLLNDKQFEIKTFAVCYEDMWGNFSCQEFDEKGLKYNVDKVSFTYHTTSKSHKIQFVFNK